MTVQYKTAEVHLLKHFPTVCEVLQVLHCTQSSSLKLEY